MLTRRRFAKALSLSLTLVVALLALTSPWGIEAKPQIPFHPKIADIEVSITASSDPRGTHPISNGDALVNCGSTWFRFTIKNKGSATANNFSYKMTIRDNGVKVYDPPLAYMTLASGESKSFLVEAKGGLILKSHELKAVIYADMFGYTNIFGTVPETNNANNSASFTTSHYCKFELKTPVEIDKPYPHTPISRSNRRLIGYHRSVEKGGVPWQFS